MLQIAIAEIALFLGWPILYFAWRIIKEAYQDSNGRTETWAEIAENAREEENIQDQKMARQYGMSLEEWQARRAVDSLYVHTTNEEREAHVKDLMAARARVRNGMDAYKKEEKPEPEVDTCAKKEAEAKKWIMDNADLITELTRPDVQNPGRTIEIKAHRFGEAMERSTKERIATMLLEVYNKTMRYAAIDPVTGNLVAVME